MTQKFPPKTYFKLGLLIVLYFYALIHSIILLIQRIQSHKDLMEPLLWLVFCLIFPTYAIVGRIAGQPKGNPNPLDKKMSPITIAALLILIAALLGWVVYYATTHQQ
jgi:Mn2+/Fe2+ NRAMP family transporter